MDNQTALNTLAVLRQLENEKGMHIKFEYALVKNIDALKSIQDVFQKIATRPVEGQEDWEIARKEVVMDWVERDEEDNPITQPNSQGGTEYVMENMEAFTRAMEAAEDKHRAVLDAIDSRNQNLAELLEEEAAFVPYLVHVRYLPNKNGESSLTIAQLRTLMPFLEGDIDELED
jgi:hypothetical protein